jgi:heme exporter protein CcmD
MTSYAVFILSAYLAVLVILGGLTIASLSARRRVRRELARRGLERQRAQRAGAAGATP